MVERDMFVFNSVHKIIASDRTLAPESRRGLHKPHPLRVPHLIWQRTVMDLVGPQVERALRREALEADQVVAPARHGAVVDAVDLEPGLKSEHVALARDVIRHTDFAESRETVSDSVVELRGRQASGSAEERAKLHPLSAAERGRRPRPPLGPANAAGIHCRASTPRVRRGCLEAGSKIWSTTLCLRGRRGGGECESVTRYGAV